LPESGANGGERGKNKKDGRKGGGTGLGIFLHGKMEGTPGKGGEEKHGSLKKKKAKGALALRTWGEGGDAKEGFENATVKFPLIKEEYR